MFLHVRFRQSRARDHECSILCARSFETWTFRGPQSWGRFGCVPILDQAETFIDTTSLDIGRVHL